MKAIEKKIVETQKETDSVSISLRFGKQGLENLFTRIGTSISRPIKAYLIGGGAMAFRNQKPTTKDIDVVVKSKTEATEIASVLNDLGYKQKLELEKEYQAMEASGGIWEAHGRVRVDLFVNTVCGCLKLTPDIEERSVKLGDYDKLSVYLFSNEDVILFKGITERVDDTNDIAAIIRSSRIDWNTVLDECKKQSQERAWFGPLLDKITDLKDQGIDISIERGLKHLDEIQLLKEAFQQRIGKMTAKKAIKELIEGHGATEKELEEAGI